MYLIFRQFHSYAAILLLLILTVVVVISLFVWLSKKSITLNPTKIALVGMVTTHIQIGLGMILYFISPLGISNFSGDAMKISMSRLFLVEHPIMMLLAVLLVTIGFVKAKKATTDSLKFKYIAIFYSIGFIFILSRIPWSMWL